MPLVLTAQVELFLFSLAVEAGPPEVDGGGDIYNATQPGSTIVPKGSRFKFSAPSGSTGITRVTVKENGRDPGLFKLTLKTREAWTPGLANETELTTEVTLNVGGQCFRGNATKVR